MTRKRLDDAIEYWRTLDSGDHTEIAGIIRDTIKALEQLRALLDAITDILVED